MSKTGNSIKMLTILASGQYFSIDELAKRLKTKSRNVRIYRDELEQAGFIIDSKKGPHGGYYLSSSISIPVAGFSNEEIKTLHDAYQMLINNPAFLKRDDLLTAFGKVFSALHNSESPEEALSIYSKAQELMDPNEIEKRYDFILSSIKNKDEIEVTYNFVQKEKEKIILHVYEMNLYNGAYYFTAFNVNEGEIYTYLKLTRIENYRRTGKKFEIWKGYKNLEKNIDRKIGKLPIDVTFIAKGFLPKLLKERRVGESQEILEEYSDGSIKIKVKFKDEESALRYVTGCRDKLVVLSPDSIIDSLLDYSLFINSTYKTK